MRRVIISICTLVLVSCGSKRESTRPVVGDISESAYGSGIIKSRDQYQVFSVVNGLVAEVFVKEGERVKRGQAILKLSNTATRLMQENARLAADYAGLSVNADKLRDLRLSIDLARSKVIDDSLLMIRQQNLRRQNIGTQVEWEQRQLAYKNSRTAWQAAIIRYNDMERQLKFAATQSRKSYEITTSQVADYTLLSEVDGIVYQLMKTKGEMVSSQSPVAVIGEADHFIIELQIDEADIARIAPGQNVILTMDSYPGKVFEAVVDRIYPMMNERTKSFLIEALFTKGPDKLFPNLTVEANVILLVKKKAITIPRSYLVNDSLVMKEDGKLYHVDTGLKDYQRTEILHGLEPEEIILKP